MSSSSVVYFRSSPLLFPSYAINTGSPCRSRRGSCPAWRQQVLAACNTSCTVKYTLVSRGSNAIRQQRLYTSYVYIQSTVNTNNWLTSGQPMSLSTPPFTDLRLGQSAHRRASDCPRDRNSVSHKRRLNFKITCVYHHFAAILHTAYTDYHHNTRFGPVCKYTITDMYIGSSTIT